MAFAVAFALTIAVDARAQGRRGSFELSVGGLWSTGSAFDRADATETRNEPGGGDFVLFQASTTIEAGAGGEARLAFYLTPRVALEAGGLFARQQLSTRLTGDVEGIPDTTAVEDVTEYAIDGAVIVHLRAFGALVPFVRAGAGYLRHLHDGASLVETGAAYHAGGGVSYWFSRRPGFVKAWGIRGDARVLVRDGGFSVDEGSRAGGVVTGALLMAF